MLTFRAQDAAVKGLLIWGAIGASSCLMAHYIFPGFRRQTLALKGFLTSGAAIFGFTIYADTTLLNHEGQQRTTENRIRNLARADLGRQGIIASEAEIQRWKENFKREYRERAMAQESANETNSSVESSS